VVGIAVAVVVAVAVAVVVVVVVAVGVAVAVVVVVAVVVGIVKENCRVSAFVIEGASAFAAVTAVRAWPESASTTRSFGWVTDRSWSRNRVWSASAPRPRSWSWTRARLPRARSVVGE